MLGGTDKVTSIKTLRISMCDSKVKCQIQTKQIQYKKWYDIWWNE